MVWSHASVSFHDSNICRNTSYTQWKIQRQLEEGRVLAGYLAQIFFKIIIYITRIMAYAFSNYKSQRFTEKQMFSAIAENMMVE